MFPSSVSLPPSSFSPAGLHVLVVDDDPVCLMVLNKMLTLCDYKVTISNRVSHALHLLREKSEDFDLVLSDVYMPDEDGFKLLEIIGLELDLPVIMMSANGDTSVVLKGIIHGACDYLIKPVRMEELRNIWQHVVRRKARDFNCRFSVHTEDYDAVQPTDAIQFLSRKRKEDESVLEMTDCSVDDISTLKKVRVSWSVQLHQQFVNAVNQLGVERAVPKKILEIMNVQGLTRENVSSHLQKYRLYLKRLSGVMHEPHPIASFHASEDGSVGGAMQIKSGGKVGRGHGASVTPAVKSVKLGAGAGSTSIIRQQGIEDGRIESLSCFKFCHQTQKTNEEVLGSLAVTSETLDISLLPRHIDSPASSSVRSRPIVPDRCTGDSDGCNKPKEICNPSMEASVSLQSVCSDNSDMSNISTTIHSPRMEVNGPLSRVVASSARSIPAGAHEQDTPDQVSINALGPEVFSSNSSFDVFVDPAASFNLPSPLVPHDVYSTELDVSDYLLLDDHNSFTFSK